MRAPRDVWYLDLCAFRHLINNKDLFVKKLYPKCLDFTTTGGQILWAEGIGTIAIPLSDGSLLKLQDIAYAPDNDSNLISLGQLRDSNITYVDNSKAMILMQTGHLITHTKRDRNIFVLEVATPNKAMQITGRGQPTYLVSKSRKIRVWHCRFGHASNAKIIKASKLWTGMGNFSKVYDPTKVYSNSKQSNNNPSDNKGLVPTAKVSLLVPSPDNNFDSLCTPCIASKQTRIVIKNKPLSKASEKLNEVHVDLWGPHYPLSLLGKTYTAILLDAKTRKSWVLYLRSKDKFVDVFTGTWLLAIENQCSKSMKALCANGRGSLFPQSSRTSAIRKVLQ